MAAHTGPTEKLLKNSFADIIAEIMALIYCLDTLIMIINKGLIMFFVM